MTTQSRPVVTNQTVPPPTPKPAKQPPVRYEYKVMGILAQRAETDLNEMGDIGWLLIGVFNGIGAVYCRKK